MERPLGVGFVGSGFMTRFHIASWQGVRDADITGIASTNAGTAAEAAALARRLGVGDPTVYDDVAALARDPRVDAVWLVAPNHVRVPIVETMLNEVDAGRAELVGLACEKPLGRNLAEATRLVELIEASGLLHGYLENQVFAPSLTRGRDLLWRRGAAIAGNPYLARCAEEHGGPHRPWFWRGDLQGGGVLNDMMCHSIEAARFLLTRPGETRQWLTPLEVEARIASLKWTRPRYARRLKESSGGEVDYLTAPAEDFASAQVLFANGDGEQVLVEASTSWSFVGPGLRLTFETIGPEYSLTINSLEPEGRLFFSREVQGEAGEDLVEKQAAEQGSMPFLADETFVYGYTAENRHMVDAFRRGQQPRETWHDGLEVTRLLMAMYRAAEQGRSLRWPVEGLEAFVPAVARGTWDPRA